MAVLADNAQLGMECRIGELDTAVRDLMDYHAVTHERGAEGIRATRPGVPGQVDRHAQEPRVVRFHRVLLRPPEPAGAGTKKTRRRKRLRVSIPQKRETRDGLLSHPLEEAVPSALQRFTAGFGMGPGGSTAL
jgi:hypothetical protein